jgi:xylitol oxidase
VERNWAGNITYRAAVVHHPTSVAEVGSRVRAVAGRRGTVHALGSRHCFNDIADADELIALDALPASVELDRDTGVVTCNPALTYGALATALAPHGRGLHNLASLPHISVGGAVATGTHGSGDRFGNLATAVRSMTIVTADGEVVELHHGDPDFDGAVVHLGALGVVVRIGLATEPAYEVAQRVYLDLDWAVLAADVDAVTGAGDSVSLFTTWGPTVEQVWVKQRVDPAGANPERAELFGARPATVDVHPIPGVGAEHCTSQLGVPGGWADRLPHFRMGFTPSSGDELQSELLLPRAALADAITVMRELQPALSPHLLISEIRTVAADELWMSGQHGRDTVCLHTTWRPRPGPVAVLVDEIERRLTAHSPRMHWGKVMSTPAETAAQRYQRHADFLDLVQRFDPAGAFRTPWLERHVLG